MLKRRTHNYCQKNPHSSRCARGGMPITLTQMPPAFRRHLLIGIVPPQLMWTRNGNLTMASMAIAATTVAEVLWCYFSRPARRCFELIAIAVQHGCRTVCQASPCGPKRLDGGHRSRSCQRVGYMPTSRINSTPRNVPQPAVSINPRSKRPDKAKSSTNDDAFGLNVMTRLL